MSRDLETITVGVYTGNPAINQDLVKELTPLVKEYNLTFVAGEDDPQVVITLPELLNIFTENVIVVLLSDDYNHIINTENVAEVSPFPVGPDDFERLAWRLIKVIQGINYGF